MRADAFHFSPPVRALVPEISWVLSRAFGPRSEAGIELEQPAAVAGWARALGLGERIASRSSRRELATELPADVAEELAATRERLAARTLLLQRLLDRVAEIAMDTGLRIIALKGIALLEAGVAELGARPLVDLDLLVEHEGAAELHRALRAVGLTRSASGERHHLPTLADRRLGEVELHFQLPGLGISGDRSTTADDLRRAELIRPSERLEGLDLPTRPLLAAHAVVHALDQHGLSPSSYPVTRLIADLVDLGDADERPEVARWIARSVSQRELRAVRGLRRALTAGELRTAGDDGLALLHHSIVAISSPRYRRRLRRRSALRALRRRQWSKFGSELYRRVQAYRGLE